MLSLALLGGLLVVIVTGLLSYAAYNPWLGPPKLIFRVPPGFLVITGFTTDPYLERWLAVTGVLFACSAVAYAVRLRRAGRARDAVPQR